MRLPAALTGARLWGGVLCAAGFMLLWAPALWQAALGMEAIAAGFWLWARGAEHPLEQLQRWGWLRRPAGALWLAAAAGLVLALGGAPRAESGPVAMLRLLQALGLVWAGLELLAALPIARSFSDLPGPLVGMRPWLPSLLPAAGFAVLWRHAAVWTAVAPVRESAIALLLLTAWLGALRAFGRRQWSAGLRWLLVTDGALAGLLVALDVVVPLASLLLWLAAWGGRAYLLANELTGQTSRRTPWLRALWRVATAVASASIAWPVLLTLAFAPGGRARLGYFAAAAIPIALGAAITATRMVKAPERRQIMRPHSTFTLGHIMAFVTLALGPGALLIAWWGGFEATLAPAVAAALPALLGLGLAVSGRELPGLRRAREGARALYRLVVDLERALVALVWRLLRALASPVRDLHAGDAQEYLLFVIGVAVFVLILPLLQ